MPRRARSGAGGCERGCRAAGHSGPKSSAPGCHAVCQAQVRCGRGWQPPPGFLPSTRVRGADAHATHPPFPPSRALADDAVKAGPQVSRRALHACLHQDCKATAHPPCLACRSLNPACRLTRLRCWWRMSTSCCGAVLVPLAPPAAPALKSLTPRLCAGRADRSSWRAWPSSASVTSSSSKWEQVRTHTSGAQSALVLLRPSPGCVRRPPRAAGSSIATATPGIPAAEFAA